MSPVVKCKNLILDLKMNRTVYMRNYRLRRRAAAAAAAARMEPYPAQVVNPPEPAAELPPEPAAELPPEQTFDYTPDRDNTLKV